MSWRASAASSASPTSSSGMPRPSAQPTPAHRLVPPAVKLAQVECAVEDSLHALVPLASCGRGGVQPDVAALDHQPRDGDVVVLQEDNPPAEAFVVGRLDDALQDQLARVIARVGLAGEDDHHRASRAGSASSAISRSGSASSSPARL